MKIVCIGGGPAGLYFGLLMKLSDPKHEVTVIERNRPYDTFGWGVVFSDTTLENLREADPVSAEEIGQAFNHWDDIETYYKGSVQRNSGHGFIGIGRKKLLNILQARCEQVGVKLVFETEVTDDQEIAQKYDADLVIASDGLNSRIRTRYESTFQPDIDTRACRFVWLGTEKQLDAFTFAFVENEHGWFQAHAYKFEPGMSTFIVETRDETWQAAGLDKMSQEEGIAYCENLFADLLDGNKLISNATHLRGSAIWIRFPRVICHTWVHEQTLPNGRKVPIVLMGDAAHTAHFSIGSGTKLALEDAIGLRRSILANNGDLEAALKHYQDTRSIEVLRIQNAARNSTEWFENVARYANMEPEQFTYTMLTRSQRISHENLRLRDAKWIENFERWFAEKAGVKSTDGQPVPPMLTPFKLRDVTLDNRVVVSPMAMYSCVDGVPGDFHMVHLGSRAMGGAGLVMVEMTCPSPEARITPGCPGLWNDEQEAAFKRIVDFVHGQTHAKIGVQIGHAGSKGSTKVSWEGTDMPLDEGNWPLVSASAIPYIPGVSQVPQAMTRAQMDQVRDEFVAATRRAAKAGFDWLELHCAHGYLLSSFISPLTNHRDDEYGGSLENRLRYPLEIFKAVREVWPENLPISVRISAHDWVEGGITPDDAVEIAKFFKAAGADMIDCSSGQVSKDEQPVYGRMFQTPFADRVRNEAGIPTIAVGAIFEADHVNSIVASGRADLCALARPHLADAAWTLREAAHIGYTGTNWPKQYYPAKRQLETNFARAAAYAEQLVK
ncbi:bifunctional salicylyl-CoA 5-hydroxylase/oxidoreductase [Pusillimonas sp. CC-YST705]|uniref:Bifunctional salicylyl-CoA 5-hydroxylase/oxidoreductase n=1 Tax=Mesopusillimonas faecipullorum TaxID=2755040 RepID=A0ABS8CBZ9_9BURK|nr:bifunctional salicylyl-CoA 5-hydroxylase/oxidoreductase [Mesopusillimonas faecipullorum]MCB5363523.1 bifunctional salicylyl-CoA 5-hydroxylase/oxidoreductase [Mesopusillimonas faecipullorum]